MVAGNAERLGQTVVNLLVNAIDAASQHEAGGGSPAQVRIEILREVPERLTLSVADTGSGPAADVQQTLFDPFVTDKPDGVGLGLSVAREVVDEHGGRIAWHRAEGRTYFTVELPVVARGGRLCRSCWLSMTSNRFAGASRGSAKAWAMRSCRLPVAEQAFHEGSGCGRTR